MCTLEKRDNLYILTLTGTHDHRLNPSLIDSIQSALRQIRSSPASALITTAQGNYFSNGYDLDWARSAPSPDAVLSRYRLMSSKLRSLAADLISLPMPTIAAVNGHASAGGFLLALCHDYLFMRRERGFLYMSELDIGLVVPEWFDALLRCKVPPRVRREVVLRAAKLTAEMAVERGIAEKACDGAEGTLEAAVALGRELAKRKWDGHVYAKNRRSTMHDVLDSLVCDETVGEVKPNNAIVKPKL
ncbi:hypothetical protein Tsubulata_018080 [Turnera subulata]|uniref:Delta(3)-Delta(2)-enoyl-CoA isomerase n=1 Tax=Turnera subulata TaxID=218843 RepID=A0A9Q0FGQ9_9ROSI|nr:hypothetical protein Tsubulata_018080 [Turnera subulata]